MKFKVIFIIFNVIITLSFLLIFLMPIFLMGFNFFSLLLPQNYIIAAIFILFLILFNTYFLLNWRLFEYFEKEDWNGLKTYLEGIIFSKNKINTKRIKILINAYIMTSNLEGIIKLEKCLMEKQPNKIKDFAIQFSIPYLLSQTPEQAENFFNYLLSLPNLKQKNWIQWNKAFCLMQQNKTENVKNELISLLDTKNDFILKLLTLYLLDSYSNNDKNIKDKIKKTVNQYLRQIDKKKWQKILNKAKNNIEVVILSKVINDASEWFFAFSQDKVLNSTELQ